MGGWYHARALYRAEELGGLPLARFCEALRAEGYPAKPGANTPLHLQPGIHQADIYGDGQATVLANATRDVRAAPGSLPVSESIAEITFDAPWFKHYRPEIIGEYVGAVRKVVAHAEELNRSIEGE